MQEFPVDNFLGAAVRLLEYIEYQDSNYSREERIENLRYAYEKAAHHFAQERQQTLLKADPKRLQASLQTIVGMVVYSWTKVSKELMADLSIHYTYTLVLDDSRDDPHPQMLTYFDDLQSGREQKHPWWILVNEHFPNVLRHFGPFCSLNLIRSTLDCRSILYLSHYTELRKVGKTNTHDFLKFSKAAGLSSTTFMDITARTIIPASSAASTALVTA